MPPLNLTKLALFLSILSYGYAAEINYYVNKKVENRLRIGVPVHPFSEKFVKVNRTEKTYSGFCVRVFEEAIKLSKLEIDYDFVDFDGTYDDLVYSVANKTFDAAVGDITITSKRWTLVDFTEPFTESGLSIVVPVKHSEGWIFLKPFTVQLWIAIGGILVYTMFVIWFIEHRSNPEFDGQWNDQLGSTLWFTFSSLFLAYKERINRSHTRVVVVMWLFVALILTQSYTASLTSMLTVKRLNPNKDYLRTENAKVGCDENTSMKNYVEKELGHKSENIKFLDDDKDYFKAFKNRSISAALLEIPYAKLFVNMHCKEFTVTGSSYRFGGLSFAFQKGSGIAYDISEAILKLSENGMLKILEESWLTSSSKCSDSNTTENADSLSFRSFCGVFLLSTTISTLCFLLFIVRLLKDYRHQRQTQGDDSDGNVWKKLVRVVRYLKDAVPSDRRLAPSSSKVVPKIEVHQEPENVI